MDFSSIQPVDSDGVPIGAYVLSFNRGSILEPAAWGNATFLDIMFGLYKFIAWVCLALVNMVSQLDWLSPFVGLLESVSDTVTSTLGAMGVFAMALGVMAAGAAANWARSRNHRTLYQLGLMVVCIMVAIAMVSPVRLAGKMLGLGRDAGTQVGAAAAQTRPDATLSMILADKLVREPTQRWNFGQSLDALGCGQQWSDRILAGNQDQVKEAALSCVGGESLHAYAMAPVNAIYDGFFALGSLAVFVAFIVFLTARMLGTGFATVMHAAAVKPLTPFLPASPAIQSVYVRNGLAAGLGACKLFGDVLIFICGAAFIAGMATLVGSSAEASVITAVSMIGVVVGARIVAKNMKGQDRQLATRISHSPGIAPLSGTTQSATQLARRVVTAQAMHGLAPRVLTGALASGRGAGQITSSKGETPTTVDAIRSAGQNTSPTRRKPAPATPRSHATTPLPPETHRAATPAASESFTDPARAVLGYNTEARAATAQHPMNSPVAESITAAAHREDRLDPSHAGWIPPAATPQSPPREPSTSVSTVRDRRSHHDSTAPAAGTASPVPPLRTSPRLPAEHVDPDAVDQATRSASAAHQRPGEQP